MKLQTFVRCPLRLSLLGGGTDLPHVINRLGKGRTITGSLNLFVTVGCTNLPLFNGIKLKYSNNEIVGNIDSIIHPIFKEALKHFEFDLVSNQGLEIISTANLPSGNGLGSSGAFTVCLMQCLNKHLNNKVYDKNELLRLATSIEHISGNSKIGFQDQIAAIYGSFIGANYENDDINIEVPSKEWILGMKNLIECKGYLIKTNPRQGISSDFIKNENNEKNFKIYEEIFNLANEINIKENSFDEEKMIEILKESANISKKNKVQTNNIQELETYLKSNGAEYCKQLGAGGGGFLFCLFKSEIPNIPDDLRDHILTPKINEEGIKIF